MGTDDVTTSIKDAFSAGLVFAAPTNARVSA